MPTTTATARSIDPASDQTTFRALGVSEPGPQALRMRGVERPFAIQSLVLPDALAGSTCWLARAPARARRPFAVPLVERLHPSGTSPTGLILAPTRELASQVTEEFRAIADVRHLQVASVYGGVGIGPQAKRARHADIVIATPGGCSISWHGSCCASTGCAPACSTRPTACWTWASCRT